MKVFEIIIYDEVNKEFHLYTKNNQLSLGVLDSNHLVILYYGERIRHSSLGYTTNHLKHAGFLASTDSNSDSFQLELLPQVMPTYGNTDLRTPAIHLNHNNKSTIFDFRFIQYHIYKGKKMIEGLPSTFSSEDEVETLEITLRDNLMGVELTIFIHAFYEYDVFTQHVSLTNKNGKNITIEKIMSVSMDFLHSDFDLIQLSGAWTRETQINRRELKRGFQGIDSKRGASGHGQNPFVALVEKDTDYNKGISYGFNFVYSGNFLIDIEVDMFDMTRLQMGLNPFDFSWVLEKGETFYTPEVVMVYTKKGLNEMSRCYHEFYQNCLINPQHSWKDRPILINNWEATYFDFTYEKLIELAKISSEMGIELFVLDDGWFGERDTDKTSLGDWYPNSEKLGGSLTRVIDEINKLGLDFGLWIEPEMISRKSDLFQKHPDWIIQQEGRYPQESRNQYVLDLSKKEVQNFIIETVTTLLNDNNIKYLKWDMNRNITNLGTNNPAIRHIGELSHKYILGLYYILNEIVDRHPEVLIESCAGGGGRFDAGMLYYTPQIWTSDNTDAIERLNIQTGASLVYPPSTMGCHISESPNHQINRETSIETRAVIAYQGILGFEMDLTKVSTKDKETMMMIINEYKVNRSIFQFGRHFRLKVYDSNNEEAWMKTFGNKSIVSHVYRMAKSNVMPKRLKLNNLEKHTLYRVKETDELYFGEELMNIGLLLPKPSQDFLASFWTLIEVEKRGLQGEY